MSELLSKKSPSLQAAIERLICAIGPERLAVGEDPIDDPDTISVVSRADPSHGVVISVAGMPEGHYSVTYDKLRTKRGGDASIGQATAAGALFEGMAWITRKVVESGFVTGELERPPKRRRRLHE